MSKGRRYFICSHVLAHTSSLIGLYNTMNQPFSLQHLHTFAVATKSKDYASFSEVKVLQDMTPLRGKYLVLGGGSNVLFTKDFEGLILHNQIKGIECVEEDTASVLVRVGGGVIWHDLVLWAIKQGLGGIENLSLIPGSVGAAPVQNIGAYGVEFKDVFDRLEAVHLQTGKLEFFDNKACQFAYRDSVFKQQLKGQYCICRVWLRLNKKPVLNTSYGIINDVIAASKQLPSIESVSRAVIQIRQRKLPDPAKLGNAGSFFKNPIISLSKLSSLKMQFPEMPFYPVGGQSVKLAAGWIIDKLGWKGYRKGDAGVHRHQALVLVNYGNAQGKDIWELAMAIQTSVHDVFGVVLETEVNIL